MAYDKLVDSSQLNSDLGYVADAIRAKSGGSSQLAFPSGFISEIGSISTGGGGGMVKKAGTFTLASDYTYATSLANGYSGSILVNTGLSKIHCVSLWTEDWLNQSMTANGVGCYFAINNTIPVVASKTGPAGYYMSYGVFKANTNYYYPYVDFGGIVLHAACPNDVPDGSFGFQCRSSGYPIKAEMTVHWEAVGEE